MTNKIWVTPCGMVHYRKPDQEAKEYIAVEQMPPVSGMGVVAESGRCAIPEGYALVPIDPTREMIKAAWSDLPDNGVYTGYLKEKYKAMIAAAPKVGV